MKILIAEDDAVSQRILVALLEKSGHEVLVTENGKEAWDVLQKPDAPSLIILDWMMPIMDGLTVVRQVRGLQTDNPPYIIMLTAKHEMADILDGLKAGANDYLAKPFVLDELQARIDVGRRVLELQTALADKVHDLQEKATNFDAFFETMSDMMFVATREGRILFTNTAVTRLLGYNTGELASMHILDMHPADKRQEAEVFFETICRSKPEACLIPFAAKNGTIIPVETRIWFGHWNGMDCIFGISKNLTIEQEHQQRFEQLFRNNPALMALSTIPDRRFFDINTSFLRALGYSRSEVIDKTVTELSLFPDAAQQERLADKLQTEGRIIDSEMQVRRKDGSTLYGSFSGEIMISNGRQYFLTVMIDISDRKRAQEELRNANAMLTRRQLELQDVYHTVSHELKTPLTSAREFAAIILDGIAGPLTGDQKQYLQLIVESCDQLESCINDLLEVTRLESGKLLLHLVDTSIEPLVTNAVSAMAPAMAAKGITIRCKLDPKLTNASLDARRIIQVCTNLLSNALKFTPSHGIITVRVENDPGNPECIRFSISDTGCGIAPENLERIFDRLFQVRTTDASIMGGVGLGLFIAHEIVHLHKGRIWAESTVGRGSTFFFTIPRKAPASDWQV